MTLAVRWHTEDRTQWLQDLSQYFKVDTVVQKWTACHMFWKLQLFKDMSHKSHTGDTQQIAEHGEGQQGVYIFT